MAARYQIGPRFEALIEHLVSSGRYADASEVVGTALHLLEEQEAERERMSAELRAKIDEGIADLDGGRVYPADEVFAEIREMIARKRHRRDAAE